MSSVAAQQSGSIASETPLRVGTATIANAGYSVQVTDAAITANSVIICWGVGTVEAVGGATVFSVDNIVAGSFYINSDQAVATAAPGKGVAYAVLRY